MDRARGIDVSRYQQERVNWTTARDADRVRFAFIRASHGTQADPYCCVQSIRAERAGILRGAYHYLYPQMAAAEQAKTFHLMTVGHQLEIGPVLDVEQKGLTEADVRAWIRAYEDLSGTRPMIYTAAGIWHSLVGYNAQWAAQYDLWVANWTERAEPRLPRPWQKWTFWQRSSEARLNCYSGPLDFDLFNGTEQELRARYGGASATAAGR